MLAPRKRRRREARAEATVRLLCLGAVVLVSSGCLDFDALSGNWEQGVGVDGGSGDAAMPDLVELPDLLPVDLVGADLTRTCNTTPCDVVCQNNCMMGQKCALVSGGAGCVQTGTVPTGGACMMGNGSDNCAPGNTCVKVSNSGLSLCFLYCRTNADCTNNGVCGIDLGNATFKACSEPLTNCNPIADTGCGGMGNCFVIVNGTGQTGCHGAGSGGHGASCWTSYDCQPKHTCYAGECRQNCSNAVSSCPFLNTCENVPGWDPNKIKVCRPRL